MVTHCVLDLELDLEGLSEPKWAHHSFRRTADRFARLHPPTRGVIHVALGLPVW